MSQYGQPQGGYGAPDPQSQGSPYGAPGGYGQYGQSSYGQYGQPSYGQQPGYGMAPQPGGYGPQGEHPQAQTVMILGILAFFVPFLSFVAWYIGGNARKEIQAGAPYRFDGGLSVGYWIGKILSIISIVSAVATILFFVVFVGLLGVASI